MSRRLEKKRSGKAALDQKVNDLWKQLEDEVASAAVLAVDIVELEKGLHELQRRAMLPGAATTACGERVFHLVLESLPKQMAEKPEFMALLLGTVRASMAELFTMVYALPETVTHVTSSDAGQCPRDGRCHC